MKTTLKNQHDYMTLSVAGVIGKINLTYSHSGEKGTWSTAIKNASTIFGHFAYLRKIILVSRHKDVGGLMAAMKVLAEKANSFEEFEVALEKEVGYTIAAKYKKQ